MIRRRIPRFYQGQILDILRKVFLKKTSPGEYIELFEEKFSQYTGTKFALATCSGRHSLELLLDAFGLKEGDEIILPSYTLKDLIRLIERKGFIPKLVDVEKSSFNINLDLITGQISPKTKVIVATHIFGLPCNLRRILAIAEKYGLKVIEDCAHALGAKYDGKRVGSFGDAAFFSFETLKSINTFGGGMITVNDEAIAGKIREKINSCPLDSNKILSKILFTYIEYLIVRSPFYPFLISFFMFKPTTFIISKLYLLFHRNSRVKYSRFSDLQAFMGLKQLENLDERNGKRSALAYALIERVSPIASIQESESSEGRIFYFLVARLPFKKDIVKIRKKLIMQGIDAGIKDEITDNCACILGRDRDFPAVEEIFKANLQLPLYDNMAEKDIEAVIRGLKKCL